MQIKISSLALLIVISIMSNLHTLSTTAFIQGMQQINCAVNALHLELYDFISKPKPLKKSAGVLLELCLKALIVTYWFLNCILRNFFQSWIYILGSNYQFLYRLTPFSIHERKSDISWLRSVIGWPIWRVTYLKNLPIE